MTEDDLQEWYPTPRYLLRKDLVIRLLRRIPHEGKSILDVGYGSGDMLCSYCRLGMEAHGFDFSPFAVDEARRQIQRSGLPEEQIHLHLSESDTYARQYDVISAFEVLEHVENDIELLDRWRNCLTRPTVGANAGGGYILLSVPSRMKKWNISDKWAGHFRRYEKAEIREKLEHCGFNILELYSYPFPMNLFLDRMMNRNKAKDMKNYEKGKYSMVVATQHSGVRRGGSALQRAMSNRLWMMPFILLQRLFLHTDLGSGYVILAQRVSE